MALEDLEQGRAERDIAFDAFLALPDSKKARLMEWLWPLFEGAQERRRGWKERDREALRSTLCLLVVNALSGVARESAVHYSRRLVSYSGRSPYYPPWLASKTMLGAVDGLERLGFLETTKGSQPLFAGPGRQSTFAATRALVEALRQLDIAPDDLARRDDAPVLVLKDGDRRLVNYDLTGELVRMDHNLRAYNRFLKGYAFGLNIPSEEVERYLSTRDDWGRARRLPRLTDTDLYRVFNGGWGRNGRFYGGWWQTIPSAWRERITINGEPTIELDFSAFMPRAAYHLAGLDCTGDPYEIPAIREAAEAQGLEWEDHVRDSVKVLLVAMFNTRRERPITGLSNLTLPRGFKRGKGIEAIIDHHRAVREWFFDERGLSIMNIESRICEDVLMNGLASNVGVLPIHDSFIVPESARDWLAERMTIAYKLHLRGEPVIHFKRVRTVNESTTTSIDS